MNRFILAVLLIFSFSVWSAPSVKKKASQQIQRLSEETEEGENFTPSLSETLNDSNQLKSRIKRQLAKELDANLTNDIADRKPKGQADSINAIARFGDFEVGISERGEEELVRVKKDQSNQ